MCSVSKSCLTLCDPINCRLARLLCPWYFLGKNTGSGLPFPPPGVLPDPGIQPASLMSPALQAGSLSPVPPGKPMHKAAFKQTWNKMLPKCSGLAALCLGLAAPCPGQLVLLSDRSFCPGSLPGQHPACRDISGATPSRKPSRIAPPS